MEPQDQGLSCERAANTAALCDYVGVKALRACMVCGPRFKALLPVI